MCFNNQSVLDDGDASHRRPIVTSDPNLPNVVVLGPMGGGVSSVVNLIAGEKVAKVSNDAARCTTKMAHWRVELTNSTKIQIMLYDVPGFDSNAISLVEFPCVPISLAVICMKDFPKQVKATAKYLRNEWGNHGDGNIPVLVVIIRTTPEPDDVWWEVNEKHFSNLAVMAGHVCLARRKEDSTEQLQSLIIQHLSVREVYGRRQLLGSF